MLLIKSTISRAVLKFGFLLVVCLPLPLESDWQLTLKRQLRAGARCTNCGEKGATLQHPGWAGNHIGFYPFPTEIADQMRDDDPTRTL